MLHSIGLPFRTMFCIKIGNEFSFLIFVEYLHFIKYREYFAFMISSLNLEWLWDCLSSILFYFLKEKCKQTVFEQNIPDLFRHHFTFSMISIFLLDFQSHLFILQFLMIFAPLKSDFILIRSVVIKI